MAIRAAAKVSDNPTTTRKERRRAVKCMKKRKRGNPFSETRILRPMEPACREGATKQGRPEFSSFAEDEDGSDGGENEKKGRGEKSGTESKRQSKE